MKRTVAVVFGILGVAVSVLPARADPLGGMYTSSGLEALAFFVLFALAVGNALIGVLEGSVVAWRYQLEYGRTIGIMVLANLFSALIGFFLGDLGRPEWRIEPALVVAALFVVAVILEWPFLLWALPKGPEREATAWKASVLAQAVSYPVVILVAYSVGLHL